MLSRMTTRGSAASRRRLAFSGVLLALAGCADYHLTVPDSDPIQLEGQKDPYVVRSANAYVWGLVLDPEVLPAECQGQGINDVFVKRNFGQDLASVVTLGLWMPAEVAYRCKAPPTRGGTI